MEKKFVDVGKRIAELRADLTQAEFAARLDVDRKTVVRWEAGERLPDGASLFRLMSEFGGDVNYLLTGQSGVPTPKPERMSPRQRALLENYEALSEEGRRHVDGAAALLAKQARKAA